MVSNIGDAYKDAFPDRWPNIVTWIPQATPNTPTEPDFVKKLVEVLGKPNSPVTREEFEALKNEVRALVELMNAAKEFDVKTGQPDCEQDEKIALIKALMRLTGIAPGDLK